MESPGCYPRQPLGILRHSSPKHIHAVCWLPLHSPMLHPVTASRETSALFNLGHQDRAEHPSLTLACIPYTSCMPSVARQHRALFCSRLPCAGQTYSWGTGHRAELPQVFGVDVTGPTLLGSRAQGMNKALCKPSRTPEALSGPRSRWGMALFGVHRRTERGHGRRLP